MVFDTMSYKYKMNSAVEQTYTALVNEQYRFFHSINPEITNIEQGTSIEKRLTTKMGNEQVKGTITIQKLEENQKIQLITEYAKGSILQVYELKSLESQTEVSYSEKNTYDTVRGQYSFMLARVVYKYFYNRGMKKRMRYIEQLAQMY